MMRIVLILLASAALAAPVLAQPALSEPPEFPSSWPGPGNEHTGSGCFWLASGNIEPGDVDWLQVSIPNMSSEVIVDVDFTYGTGNSLLLAWTPGGLTVFNGNDNNGALDDLCGLGGGSDPLGSSLDSIADLGEISGGVVIHIGVTGTGDAGFCGNHSEDFAYDVWVYALGVGGCEDDTDCDDGLPCTWDICDAATSVCEHEPDDSQCDDGLFCNGLETCDPVDGCQAGSPPCMPGETCDELDGCLSVTLPALDIRPGSCPNPLNARSRGYLPVALLGSADFDVTHVDVSTVRLARADGVGADVAPNGGPPGPGSTFEDAGAPVTGEMCACDELGGDGTIDLIMRFAIPEVVAALRVDNFGPGESVALTVHGRLVDGSVFAATDCVRVTGGRGIKSKKGAD